VQPLGRSLPQKGPFRFVASDGTTNGNRERETTNVDVERRTSNVELA
jgi:hypothetical protein